jgi:hypothetical protein
MFVNGSEQNEQLYREPSIDASYQVSVHMAEGFQRRRLKCEKLMDERRRTTDAKWWQKLTLPLARSAKKMKFYYMWLLNRGDFIHRVDCSSNNIQYITLLITCWWLVGWFMVLSATFNNISAISWRLVLLVEETGKHLEKTTDLSQVTDKLYHIMLYRVHLAMCGFELITLVVRCTRYNIMWWSLPVTCDMSVVFCGNSGFRQQQNWPPRYNWNIVERGVKHHKTNQLTI